jgi:hypothetical protein
MRALRHGRDPVVGETLRATPYHHEARQMDGAAAVGRLGNQGSDPTVSAKPASRQALKPPSSATAR